MNLMAPLVVAVLLAFASAPAFAANELGLSSDRVHWTSSLTTPLFDPAFRWVPGDSESASFWVRNRSTEKAKLDVAVLGSAVDSLMRTGDLSVRVEAASGAGTSTTMVGRQVLLSSREVGPGQEERIIVTVAFDPTSTNQSQVKQLELSFEVRLTQDTASGRSDSDGSDSDSDGGHSDSDGALPGTGSEARSEWLWIASGMIVGGFALVSRVRRRERADV